MDNDVEEDVPVEDLDVSGYFAMCVRNPCQLSCAE